MCNLWMRIDAGAEGEKKVESPIIAILAYNFLANILAKKKNVKIVYFYPQIDVWCLRSAEFII